MRRPIHVPPYEGVPFDAEVLRKFQTRYGPFPDDYFCIDVETSGLDQYRDKIVQIGVLKVVGRRPLISKSYLINWFPDLSRDDASFLRSRMAQTKTAMEGRGKRYPWNPDLLEEHGEPPTPVAEGIRKDLGDDPFCVGHYAWFFDFPRLYNFMNQHAAEFVVSPNRLYDTCLMTRAAIVSINPSGHVAEDINHYYDRIDHRRDAPSCRLPDCIDRFGLTSKGAAAMNTKTTDAGFDAWCGHLVFEKHREAACTTD